MSANTKIEWADHTFNPWVGCTKVSLGCDHCYAEAWDRRFVVTGHAMRWGAEKPRKRTSAANWRQPLKWNREAGARGIRYRVFCASLADVFDNEVPTDWRRDLYALMESTPHLDWLLLTKRIGNARAMLNECAFGRWGAAPLPNVWLGSTVVNQTEADRDIPKLLATPAAKRFLSIEPLLGPVDIQAAIDRMPWRIGGGDACLHWVIVGGESGPHARPMHPDWARSLRDQCVGAGVPFHFKQWGEWVDCDNCTADDAAYKGKADCWVDPDGSAHDGALGVDFMGGTYAMYRVGKKNAGRLLDGRTWDESPQA